MTFGKVTITEVACSLILGILVNLLVNIKRKNKDGDEQITIEEVQNAETAEQTTNEENGNEKV